MSSPHHIAVEQPGHVTLQLVVSERLPIGRAGDGLVVDDDRVSRHHCELFSTEDGGLAVRDTGSSNGTTVNGTPIAQQTRLGVDDVVQIGRTRIIVVAPPGQPRSDRELRTTVREAALAAPQGRISQPSIAAEGTDQLRASIVGTTLTLVFSDIIDSTRLVNQLGDQNWLQVLARHDELVRAELGRFHGTEVKGQGDGFLLTFPSARHGLLFALALQAALAAERSNDEDFRLHVRAGVHTGEVLHASGDVFGRHVHRAARISAMAGSDEVIASSLVRELAESMGDIVFEPGRSVQLKGFDGAQVVHLVRARN